MGKLHLIALIYVSYAISFKHYKCNLQNILTGDTGENSIFNLEMQNQNIAVKLE